MTKLLIISVATIFSISGFTLIASAAPPHVEQISHGDTFRASLDTSVGDACQRLDIDVVAIDDMLTNCTLVDDATLAIDLTWTGIGTPEVSHDIKTIHFENGTVQHVHVQTTVLDASVTGTILVGGLDFELEDEIGELSSEAAGRLQ